MRDPCPPGARGGGDCISDQALFRLRRPSPHPSLQRWDTRCPSSASSAWPCSARDSRHRPGDRHRHHRLPVGQLAPALRCVRPCSGGFLCRRLPRHRDVYPGAPLVPGLVLLVRPEYRSCSWPTLSCSRTHARRMASSADACTTYHHSRRNHHCIDIDLCRCFFGARADPARVGPRAGFCRVKDPVTDPAEAVQGLLVEHFFSSKLGPATMVRSSTPVSEGQRSTGNPELAATAWSSDTLVLPQGVGGAAALTAARAAAGRASGRRSGTPSARAPRRTMRSVRGPSPAPRSSWR